MRKKRISFDMDGVLLDHTDAKIRAAKKLGFIWSPRDTLANVMHTLIPDDAYQAIKREVYGDTDEAFKIPLMSGALQALEGFKEKNLDFYLISKRGNPEIGKKILAIHDLWPKYFNDKNAFFVPGAGKKTDIAKRLSITHHIDDDMTVLEYMGEKVPNKFLFDPLNVLNDSVIWKRVLSLDDFLTHCLQ